MRRVVVQICAALAWIAVFIPGAFSQVIDFSSSVENDAHTQWSCPERFAGDVSFSGSGLVYGPHGTFSGGIGSVGFLTGTIGKGFYGLPENFLQSKGAELFTGNSHRGMKASYSIDPHTFCVVVSDARYISAYPSRPDTACLLIDDLAVADQGDAAPSSQPMMMFLGGIGLIGLSGMKKLKKTSASVKRVPLIIQGSNAYAARAQLRQRFESEAA